MSNAQSAEPIIMRSNEAAVLLLQQVVAATERLETSVADVRSRMDRFDGAEIVKKLDEQRTDHRDLCKGVEALDDRVKAMEARSRPWFTLGGKAVEQAVTALVSALVAGLIAVVALGARHPPPAAPAQVTVYPGTSPGASSLLQGSFASAGPLSPGAPTPPDRAPVGQSAQLPPPTRRDP